MFKELMFINVRFKGGGGGGGGSGDVGYPDYMEIAHGDWLNKDGADGISFSIVTAMNAALGNSPWTGQTAYDPDTDLTELIAQPDDLQTLVTLLSNGTTLDTLISNVLDTTRIDDEIAAFAADLDARLVSEVLPRFEGGMRDINAVVSSAFVIGRALIEEGQDRQVAKFNADVRMKAFSDDAIKVVGMKLEYQRVVSAMLMEGYRMKIVAKKEEMESNIKIDESDALWDLKVFQYGANLLAAIGGGVDTPQQNQPSQLQSAIGGAMSGAAAGAMVGSAVPGIGTAAGAIAGGVLGAASAFLS